MAQEDTVGAVIVRSQLSFPKIHVTSPGFHCFFASPHYAREIIPNFNISYVSWCKLENRGYLQN